MEELLIKIENLANEVYNNLGPGHSEAVYHKAMLVELRLANLGCESEVMTPILYKGEYVGYGRADIIVEKKVVVELKAVLDIRFTEYKKLNTYMKSLKIGRGLMINFPQRIGRPETEVRRFLCTTYVDD